MASGLFLEVEEGGKDPDEEAVKVYLIRFIADLPLSWYTGSVIEYTVKKRRAMHTKYGVLCLSRLEHLIWCEVTPNFWCVFYATSGVLSHQLSVLSH